MPFWFGPEYLALPRPEQPWVVKNIIPQAGATNIYGKPKVGKSMLALQLASAIADPAISDWFGFPVMQHGPVAYLQIDTPRSIWAERVEQLAARGLRFDNVLFADIDETPYPFSLLTNEFKPGAGFEWLRENLFDRAQPLALIVDCLREAHQVDENKSEQMQQVIALLKAATPGVAMVLLSHSRKENPLAGVNLIDDQRGSSYIAGRMDCILRVGEKSISLKGRTIPETSIGIARDENGLIALADAMVQRALSLVRKGGATDRSIARALAEEFPDHTVESCRSLVKRVREKRVVAFGSPQTPPSSD